MKNNLIDSDDNMQLTLDALLDYKQEFQGAWQAF